MLTPAEKIALEAMIDRTTLRAVLGEIAQICGEKEEHIKANWQDATTAAVWRACTAKIAKLADGIRI